MLSAPVPLLQSIRNTSPPGLSK